MAKKKGFFFGFLGIIFVSIILITGSFRCGTQGSKPNEKLTQTTGTSPYVTYDTTPPEADTFNAIDQIIWPTPVLANPPAEGLTTYTLKSPTVLKDLDETDEEKRYKMWVEIVSDTFIDDLFKNLDPFFPETHGILYAYSPDGINWTIYDKNIDGKINVADSVIEEDVANEDIGDPSILKIENTYLLFFRGDDGNGIYLATSLATSNDWEKNWSYADGDDSSPGDTDPILLKGSSGQWDGGAISAPTVIADGATYKMWYAGRSEDNSIYGIGYAYATYADDASDWKKNTPITSSVTTTESSYVLTTAAEDAWDSKFIGHPMVIKDTNELGDTIYKMWYTGSNDLDEAVGIYDIGIAGSFDGLTWEKYQYTSFEQAFEIDFSKIDISSCASTVGPSSGIDVEELMSGCEGTIITFAPDRYAPTVVKDANEFKMWFDAVVFADFLNFDFQNRGIILATNQ